MSNEAKTETGAIANAEAPKESTTAQFGAALGEVLESTGYNEMWGVTLKDGEDVPTSIVLTKFLRANDGDVSAAKKQLTSALEWRKKMKPLELIKGSYSDEKFGGLGYVTTHKDEAGKETIISWNIYGAVKDNKKTFGDVEEFIKWRAALMELSVQKLNLSAATERIPEDGDDQYQMIQVHDYLSVSFFRPDPNVKKASQEAIRVFSLAYPELLSHKYFVNVPTIMGWMYGLMKLFVAPATLKKFHPMSSGTTLGTELPAIKATLPPAYGGQGPDVKTAGETVGMVQEPTATEEKTEPTPAASADVPAPATTAAEETTAPATATADETKLAEATTEGAKSVEAPKPAEQPNPLGSSPVTVPADAQPVKELNPVEEPKAGLPVETVAPAVVENSATEATKTEAKAEEVVEKK